MNVQQKSFVAAALAFMTALPAAVPAYAQNVTLNYGQRVQVVETYCDRYPNDYDCRGYYGGGWANDEYNAFYRNRRSDLDPVASSIFGLAIGAIIGGAIANGANKGERVVRIQGDYDGHVEACYARYRSYDERSDTFLGYDGQRHRCNL